MNESSAQLTAASKMDFAQCCKKILKVLNVNETFYPDLQIIKLMANEQFKAKKAKNGTYSEFAEFFCETKNCKKTYCQAFL